jgi:DNA-directed RNA polymerase sigma subunit (sigma70/sigma32)
MIYITIEDFYKRANACAKLSREEEIVCAKQMKSGDMDARKKLVESYLPFIAGKIKMQSEKYQTLTLALSCEQMLETLVDTFDFLQEGETFIHRLSWGMRQAVTKYIAESGR